MFKETQHNIRKHIHKLENITIYIHFFTVSLLTWFGVTFFSLQPWQTRTKCRGCTSGTSLCIGLVLTFRGGLWGTSVLFLWMLLSIQDIMLHRIWHLVSLLGNVVPLTFKGFSLPLPTTSWLLLAQIALPLPRELMIDQGPDISLWLLAMVKGLLSLLKLQLALVLCSMVVPREMLQM